MVLTCETGCTLPFTILNEKEKEVKEEVRKGEVRKRERRGKQSGNILLIKSYDYIFLF